MPPLPVLYALGAGILFGLSTPAAKLLLDALDPWMLAGLLYLGSGLGLAAFRRLRPRRDATTETLLARADLPWLVGAIVSGGIAGPVLLLIGLTATAAATASLLLTLEGVATALIAWFVFRENFDSRIALGMAAIVGGSAILAWQGSFSLSGVIGPLAIAGACIAWGIDNNLTRKVSLAEPMQVAMWKGLVAGPVNLALAFALGAGLPTAGYAGTAALIGFLGYGLSLTLFVLALRHLGAARTGAYFSVAPFIGAAVAIPLLGEAVTVPLLAGGALVALGIWLHLTERHVHEHEHRPLDHAHRHVHDAHHRHAHDPNDPPGEPHSHSHRHDRLRHTHPHVPDAHHRHAH